MEFVEQGVTESPGLSAYLSELLAPYRRQRVDCIVLGCTHFPFVRESIRRALGYPVRFFEGGRGAARETQRRLQAQCLCNPQAKPGTLNFETSCGASEKKRLCQKLFGLYQPM
ncbi:MAG: glutamate racemase [Hydrogeniiclostridium mannosilyticum]